MNFRLTATVIRELGIQVNADTDTRPIDQIKAELQQECAKYGEITHQCVEVQRVDQQTSLFIEDPNNGPFIYIDDEDVA